MVFETEEPLIAKIQRELHGQEHSISSLWRVLTEERSVKIHRLELTGYLKAMADMGVLKEKPRPPSIYYALAAQERSDFYGMLGAKCASLDMSPREQGNVALYLLHRFFRRPVLLEEMRRAGFDQDEFTGRRAVKKKAQESADILSRMNVAVPRNDPAFEPEKEYPEHVVIIIDILVERMNMQKGVGGTKQATLSGFEPVKN